jgi:hypothetical protein
MLDCCARVPRARVAREKVRPSGPKRSASSVLYTSMHMPHAKTREVGIAGVSWIRKRQRRRNVATAKKASHVDSAHVHAVVFVLLLQALIRPILLLGIARVGT